MEPAETMRAILVVENMVTMALCVALVLGILYLGGGWLCLSGFLLLLNWNWPPEAKKTTTTPAAKKDPPNA